MLRVFIRKLKKWSPFFMLYVPFKLFAIFGKKRNVVLFGTGTGLYHDNPKYLFEFLLQNKDHRIKYSPYWIASDSTIYEELKIKNIPVIKKGSLRAAFYASRASAYFVSSSVMDVFYFISDQTILIQLWHGVPIKYIGYDSKFDSDGLTRTDKTFGFNYTYQRFNYFIIEDERYKFLFENAFRIEPEVIKSYGQPRNIPLYMNDIEWKDLVKSKLNINKIKKIILYAPTFRDNGGDYELIKKFLNMDSINKLKSLDFIVVLKMHPKLKDNVKIRDLIHSYNGDVLNFSDYGDIQDLLLISDVVITDISSLAFDYLIKSNDLCIYFPDQEEYIYQRGGMYKVSYDEILSNATRIESLCDVIKLKKNNVNSDRIKKNVCENIMKLVDL